MPGRHINDWLTSMRARRTFSTRRVTNSRLRGSMVKAASCRAIAMCRTAAAVVLTWQK